MKSVYYLIALLHDLSEMRKKKETGEEERKEGRRKKVQNNQELKKELLFSLSDWDCDNKGGILLTKCRKLHWVLYPMNIQGGCETSDSYWILWTKIRESNLIF